MKSTTCIRSNLHQDWRLLRCAWAFALFTSLAIAARGATAADTPASKAQPAAVVRLEQIAGVWWFRAPAGQRFLSLGMNHVEPVYWTSPNNKQFVLDTYGPDLFLPSGEFNDRSTAARKWGTRAAANLRDWGFNTLGMHNPPLESLRQAGEAYYVVDLSLPIPWGWNMKRSELLKALARRPLDVFDDAFAAEVEANAQQWVKPSAHDPRVLGYAYTDGPPWTIDDDAQDAAVRLHPWVLAIMSLPAKAKGKQAWLALLQERYPTAAAAGASYERSVSSWPELAAITAWPEISRTPAAAADSQMFLAKLMRQWYAVRRDAIRRYDQQHLILGDKLNANRDARHPADRQRSLEVLKDYVDVIFIQYYAPATEQCATLAAIYAAAQKPILIGDTACRPLWKDVAPTDQGYYGELGQLYADHVRSLFALPYVVGWHHCGYMRGLRPPYAAALRCGDRQAIDYHVHHKITLREGFITEVEAPIEPLLNPLRKALSDCETLHRAPSGAGATKR